MLLFSTSTIVEGLENKDHVPPLLETIEPAKEDDSDVMFEYCEIPCENKKLIDIIRVISILLFINSHNYRRHIFICHPS